jgi:hypothetical protein
MNEGVMPSDVPMPVDVFCMPNELDAVLTGTGPRSDVYLVGRTSEWLEAAAIAAGATNPTWLTGPDFSFHSTSEAVASLAGCGRRPV